LPYLTDRYFLNFYGGEPLLCFDLIEQAVSFLDQKNKESGKAAQYSLTTNGSSITDEVIQTLDSHRFSVVFSFDGLAQDIQRKKGNFDEAVSNIKTILGHPDIRLEINSVFMPETVEYLAESMAFIMGLGVKNINLSLSLLKPWNRQSLGRLEKEIKKLERSSFYPLSKIGGDSGHKLPERG